MSIGQLSKHQSLGLTDEQVLDMYRTMWKSRKFDERSLLMQRAGKIAFHVSGYGQEAAQVGAAFALNKEKDYFLPYYRDYAFVLSVGMTLKDLMLAAFAKAEDPNSGGRQMPGHFSHRKLRIVTGSSPVTTQVPHAVGFALASKMRGEGAVAFTTFGEGSSNQGDFHEGLNFAGVHKLPVIFMCENNQYAISIPFHKQSAGKIADRALGYGFPGVQVDGTNPLDVYAVVKQAHDRALRGEGPTLIEAIMYRIMPHSTSDDDMLYRSKEEVESNRQRDPLPNFKKYLMDCGIWNEEQDAALLEDIKREVNEATSYADAAPYPSGSDLTKHVYGDREEA